MRRLWRRCDGYLPAPLLLLFVLAVAAGGCGTAESTSAGGPRRLLLSGSRDMVPLMQDVGRRFEQSHPGWRIDVDPASERGAADARSGLADVGLLSRPLRPDETGLNAFAVGRDGVALVVHRDNPVKALDNEHLVGLFTAAYVNWREVGGPDRPVVLVGLADGRPLREAFLDFFALTTSRVKTEPTYSSEQVLAAVAASPGALGYACLGRAEQAAAKQQPIRLLPLRGVAATMAEVRAGRYPFTRPLLLLTRERPAGVVEEFISFARSEEVRDLLDEHGFAPPLP
jgi:phosphate transport system substrate-binding protein